MKSSSSSGISFTFRKNLFSLYVYFTKRKYLRSRIKIFFRLSALKYEYFAVDAQVFLNLKSRRAILKNRRTGRSIEVTYEDADYFLLWTKPNGRYICIEPWSGIPDFVDSDCDITHKIGIIKLGAGETSVKKHSIKL